MGKIKWNKLTLGFELRFGFSVASSLVRRWCVFSERVRRWRLGRGRCAVVAVRAFMRLLQVAIRAVVSLGGVELGLHCDFGY